MKLQVIIPDEEGKKIIDLAKKDSRSISSYVRKILLDRMQGSTNGTTE
jgi:hypothetical protein